MRRPSEGICLAAFTFFVGLFDLYAQDAVGFVFIGLGGVFLAHELWSRGRRPIDHHRH